MYQAIKGNGGTARYVTLPYEAHGYVGLESTDSQTWGRSFRWLLFASRKARRSSEASSSLFHCS